MAGQPVSYSPDQFLVEDLVRLGGDGRVSVYRCGAGKNGINIADDQPSSADGYGVRLGDWTDSKTGRLQPIPQVRALLTAEGERKDWGAGGGDDLTG